MNETLNLIQSLATERHNLYRLAARTHLSSDQTERLQEIDARLPVLWDAYHRELASSQRPLPLSAARQAA